MTLAMAARSVPRCARRPQLGVSLVELMVAITIGMLVTVALLGLYTNITRNNNEMAKVNMQIENGRFAIQLLETDIVHAGYWGPYVPMFDDLTATTLPTDVPTAVPDPCVASTSWSAADKTNLIGIPLQSQDAVLCGFASKKANTDLLVVRHAETCVPGVGNCEADIPGKLYFQTSLCELESATPYTLDTSGFVLHNRDCVGTGSPQALPVTAGTVADKRKFVSSIYYIRDYAVSAGDGIPTLMRSSFDVSGAQAAQPLIEGIDGFRVEVGIDNLSKTGLPVDYTAAIVWQDPTTKTIPTNRGDGVPDAYVHCGAGCTAAQLTNAVTVKLYLLARAKEPTRGYTDTKTYALGGATLGPFNDGFKRHVFSTTVRLTNVSGRRETP